MADRQDYSRQCSADMGGADESQLEQNWCNRCIQVECVRSGLGKASRFEDRVSNWHERLFEKIPRMAQNDPRFLAIARQGFATIDVGPIPEIRSTSAWHDPRDLADAAPMVVAPVAPSRFVPPQPEPVVAPEPTPLTPPTAVPVPPAVAQSPLPAPPALTAPTPVQAPTAAQPPTRPRAPLNTPTQTKQMIDRPLSAPALPPVIDPWSAPVKQANPNEVVVPRGAKIKVGG